MGHFEYSLIIFNKYKYLCNHHPNQGIKYFCHSLVPFLVNSLLWFQANTNVISITIAIFFLFWNLIQMGSGRMCSSLFGFFCTIKHFQNPSILYVSAVCFTFIKEQYSIVWLYPYVFVHYIIYGHFDVWGYYDKAAVTTLV